MKVKSYHDWINESDDILEIAHKIAQDPEVHELLIDCEEGKNESIRVTPLESARSFVAVSIDTSSLFSRVYETMDPLVALVAIIIEDTGKKDLRSVKETLMDINNGYLRYDVFAGEREMTPHEIADKYNFQYRTSPGDAIPFYTSTPIKRSY